MVAGARHRLFLQTSAKPMRQTLETCIVFSMHTMFAGGGTGTVDQSYVFASRTMDRHLAYVAMTRHRDDMRLFVNERDRPVGLSRTSLKSIRGDHSLAKGQRWGEPKLQTSVQNAPNGSKEPIVANAASVSNVRYPHHDKGTSRASACAETRHQTSISDKTVIASDGLLLPWSLRQRPLYRRLPPSFLQLPGIG